MKQAACVIIQRFPDRPVVGEVLVVSRRKKPNLWGLPGGKVDPGEFSAQAAVREVREETGVQLYVNELVPIYTTLCPGQVPYWVTTYLATTHLPNIEHLLKPEEGLSVAWQPLVSLTDPDVCPFANYNLGVLEALLQFKGK